MSDCYVGCGQGHELATDSSCVECRMGTYRGPSDQTCIDCLTGLTTSFTGSNDRSLCNLGDCQPGYYRDRITPTNCLLCPMGTYQNEKHQYSCKPCGSSSFNYTTSGPGQTSGDSCQLLCDSGQQRYVFQTIDNCIDCATGTYRNVSIHPYMVCQPCGPTRSTPGPRAKDISECTILKCPLGQEPKPDNSDCWECPKGTYKSDSTQTRCTSCAGPTSTHSTGATTSSLCEAYCPGGQEKMATGNCQDCPIGFYKDNAVDYFMTCTPCPDVNTVTPSTRTDSASKCTVRRCGPGYKRNADDSACIACPRGTYQSIANQQNCMNCMVTQSTRDEASTDVTACETFCSSGHEKTSVTTNTCMECDIGYFKDNNVDKFSECTMCHVDFITAAKGSIAVTLCNIANCTVGYKRVGQNCVACPRGTYQSEKWQTSCDSCATDKTTVNEASTSQTDCILSCPPGKEDLSGTCSECEIGYYKVEQRAAPCTMCPTNFTTSGKGSDKLADCNLVGCIAGYQRVSPTNCQPCGYGFYQPNKWSTSCLRCDSGSTTFKTASVSANDCLLDCPIGQQYNDVSRKCELCPQGTFRDKNNVQIYSCIMCGDPDRITPGEGAVSPAMCIIRNCTTPGQFRNATLNECHDCPRGKYQDTKWQDSCKPCPAGFTTKEVKSVSADACVRDCPPGTKQLGSGCQDCGIGFYRDGAMWDCTSCPHRLSTNTSRSMSVNDCNVSPCVAGKFFNEQTNLCEVCPLNMYQPRAHTFQCENCPSGRFTSTVASTRLSQCKGYCDTGNNCSPNASCAENADTRYKCTCNEDYTGDGITCTHKCDGDFCDAKGSINCHRSTGVSCECGEYYTGERCNIRRAAQNVSSQQTLTIVGIVVGVIGFILLLILIAACLYRQRRPDDHKRTPTEYDDRASLAAGGPYNYPLAYVPSKTGSVVSGARYMMPQNAEKTYDNSLFISPEDDPAVYKA